MLIMRIDRIGGMMDGVLVGILVRALNLVGSLLTSEK